MRIPAVLFLNLLLVFFVPFHSFLCSCSVVHGIGRRILHQPLFPVESTPPPPTETSYPAQPYTPVVPATPTANVVANVSVSSHRPSATGKKVAIGVSVSMAAVVLVSFSACFLYWRRVVRFDDGSEKQLVGGDGEVALPPCRAGGASGLLYLGTVEPSDRRASVDQSNGSPYRKLRSAAAAALDAVHQPSPELRPMPPLGEQPRRVELSDDETFYTPQRSMSVASVTTSESPLSSMSRRSLSTVGTGKEFTASTVDTASCSRRSSPLSRLSSSAPCDVKHEIMAPRGMPPPPPPPPPLPPLPPSRNQPHRQAPELPASSVGGQRPHPPSPPPPPKQPEHVGMKYLAHSGASSLPLPVRPLSRRQWTKPTSTASVPAVPSAEVKTKGSGSLSTQEVIKEEDDVNGGEKPKLKPLHWDKVRASSDRAMVWDQLKSSSFQLNEDMFDVLFSNSTNTVTKEACKRPVLPSGKLENRVLDPKKSQNIAILLRALNVTLDEVIEALLDGNSEGLGIELLETLTKMAPTKEEELRLRDYSGDVSNLGSAERFLKAVLDIPFAFKRIDAMLYRANFDSEVKYLRKSFACLEEACEELKKSRLFLKLLDAVLKAGNRMNVGTVRGQARAFKLDTLLKLADVKATDGKSTLLHFVVQEVIRSEGAASESASASNPPAPNKVKEDQFKKLGLKIVTGLSKELNNVKKAAGMDSDVLSAYISKLDLGVDKIKMVLQLGRTSSQGKFFEALSVFLKEAEEEIAEVKAENKRALATVKQVTEYFHGDTAREEAHPLRIFMVVRDFLSMLDHVCKEVEKTQERTIVGSAKSIRIPTSSSLPVLGSFIVGKGESSEEESSSS